MTAILTALALLLACAGLLVGRVRAGRRRLLRERNMMQAAANCWGLSMRPDETTEQLRCRIAETRRAGAAIDPIETAAYAMRLRRDRAGSKS